MRLSTAIRQTGYAFVLLALSGCPASVPPLYVQTRVSTAQEAANVYVSPYPAVPWSEIADKLEPKHDLTTEQARAIAAVTTQAQVSQFLSTFSAGLGLGLASRSDTTTTTSSTGSAEQTTTTRSRGTGTAPSSSGAQSSAIADAALTADLSKLPPGMPVDASTLLTAGTGVYQLSKILDNQISKAFYPAGYHAHLLTFQVALQPRARNLPYDVYVDLSLFPSDWSTAVSASDPVNVNQSALPPVVVYPLVIADAMETASTARSIEVIRQAALQLAGIVGKIGVNAGVSSGSDALDAVIGQVRNSIVTVGRVSNHALRIRLGAQNSGTAGVAMVPRTHNISVVVMTRWPLASPNMPKADQDAAVAKQVRGLSVTTETQIVAADGGPFLSGARPRLVLAEKVKHAVERLQFEVHADCASAPDKNDEKGQPIVLERYLDLLRAVDRQDYKKVTEKCIMLPSTRAPIGSQPTVGDGIRFQRLLAELVQIQADSRYATMFLPLKPRETPVLPDSGQLVLMTEDEASGLTTFTLRGGKALRSDFLSAHVNLASPAGKKLLAKGVGVAGNGAEVTVTVNSPAMLEPAGRLDAAKALELSYRPYDELNLSATYAVHTLKLKKEDAKAGPTNPVVAAQTLLVPDDNGAARLTLTVGEMPKEVAGTGPLRLLIKGADVRDDPQPGSAKITADGVQVAEKSLARVVLGNLSPTQPVTVTTVVKDKSGKKDVIVGDPINLRIAR